MSTKRGYNALVKLRKSLEKYLTLVDRRIGQLGVTQKNLSASQFDYLIKTHGRSINELKADRTKKAADLARIREHIEQIEREQPEYLNKKKG